MGDDGGTRGQQDALEAKEGRALCPAILPPDAAGQCEANGRHPCGIPRANCMVAETRAAAIEHGQNIDSRAGHAGLRSSALNNPEIQHWRGFRADEGCTVLQEIAVMPPKPCNLTKPT
jgi:hypothetical protein